MQPGRFIRSGFLCQFNAVAIVAGSALLALVGCTTVGDHLTGVELSRAVPTTCIQQCGNSYRALFDQERKRHLGNVEICLQQSEARSMCFDAEAARHSAEMDRLSQGLTDCQSSCTRLSGGF